MTSFARQSMKVHESGALDSRRSSSAKPLVLLLLALATLLLFDGRGQPVHGANRAYHEDKLATLPFPRTTSRRGCRRLGR